MHDLNAMSLEAMFAELKRSGLITRLIELARDEDIGPAAGTEAWTLGVHGRGDVTSQCLMLPDERSSIALTAREPGIAAGLRLIPEVLQVLGPDVTYATCVADGDRVTTGTVMATFEGPSTQVLLAERTILNFVGRMMGVATLTAEYVDAVAGTKAQICDTRKTTPGLRFVEKYAVRCGGGTSHRLGLFDGVLIKDNHIAAIPVDQLAARIGQAVERAKWITATDGQGLTFFEVEVDTLDQFQALLDGGVCGPDGVTVVLLDNMPKELLEDAIARRAAAGLSAQEIQLEASGGVRLETIGGIAASGVDRISVGALTHQAVTLDVGFDAQ